MQKGSIHGDMAFVFKICDCNHVKVGRVVRDIGEIRIDSKLLLKDADKTCPFCEKSKRKIHSMKISIYVKNGV